MLTGHIKKKVAPYLHLSLALYKRHGSLVQIIMLKKDKQI